MHIAVATAPGSAHINPGQPGKTNNQDAVRIKEYERGFVAVLCDGCGSKPYSETGADIGANIIAHVLCEQLHKVPISKLNWNRVAMETVEALRYIIQVFAQDNSSDALERAVTERFLFTAVALVVDQNTATVAVFGDGVVVIDDEVILVEPPILDSPPYIGYLLLNKTAYHNTELRAHLGFSIIRSMPLSKLTKGLIIGTDGMKTLVEEHLEHLHHPTLVQPKLLQRWLNTQTAERLCNGSFVPGKCRDDVSLVLVRPDDVQQRLLQERGEISTLKSELTKFQHLSASISEELNRVVADRDAAQDMVLQLQEKFELVKAAKENDANTHAASPHPGSMAPKKKKDSPPGVAAMIWQALIYLFVVPQRPDGSAAVSSRAAAIGLEKSTEIAVLPQREGSKKQKREKQ